MPDITVQTEGGKTRQAPPGELLKQARERLGLAQKDIAAQLNLQAETIDAVEKNDMDRLPVATYIRGYIRGYARLVKMDANMLIELYDQAPAPPPEIIPNIKKPSQTSARDKPVRAITYLITFILALLLLAWLQSRYIMGKNPGAGPDATSQPDPGQMQPTPAPLSPSLPVGDESAAENILFDSESPDQPAMDSTLPAAINPAQTSEDLMVSEDRLEFTLKHDSWIEAYDANNTRMYHGLARAGNEIKLAGTAPFSVLLGNAPGVTVRFNGDPFDPAPYTDAGIARFTLGATNQY